MTFYRPCLCLILLVSPVIYSVSSPAMAGPIVFVTDNPAGADSGHKPRFRRRRGACESCKRRKVRCKLLGLLLCTSLMVLRLGNGSNPCNQCQVRFLPRQKSSKPEANWQGRNRRSNAYIRAQAGKPLTGTQSAGPLNRPCLWRGGV